MTGIQGIPGRPGAEGRPGSEGRAGTEGRPGSEGRTGPAGDTGEVGPEGKRGADPAHRLLIMFVFTVLVMVVLSVRAERISQDVQQTSRAACERSNAATATINDFLHLLIKFSKESRALTPAEKQQRVKSYSAKVTLPLKCA